MTKERIIPSFTVIFTSILVLIIKDEMISTYLISSLIIILFSIFIDDIRQFAWTLSILLVFHSVLTILFISII